MLNATLIFRGGLGDLVCAAGRRGAAVSRGADPAPFLRVDLELVAAASLKDVVESLGVPHCEVGPVGGDLTGLDEQVGDGCRAEVGGVAPFGLEDPRFLCDGHLGRLARLLRMLGFDTLWDRRWSEAEVARRGLNEGRAVLSRNRALLKRKALSRAMLVRADDPLAQAAEVVDRFLLADRIFLLGRCSLCNGLIERVAKEDVLPLIPPRTAAWLDDYFQCRECGQLYWEGTHTERLLPILRGLGRPRPGPSSA